MSVSLNTWEKTGKTRVYVNGLIGQGYGDKVWFERQPEDCFGCDWTVKVNTVSSTSMNIDLEEKAANIIGSTTDECCEISFDKIIEMGR